MLINFTKDVESKGISLIVYKALFLSLLICLIIIATGKVYAETVKVGVLVHLTGDMAPFGQTQKKTLALAMEKMKDQFDEKIELEIIFKDTPTLPEDIHHAVKDLIIKQGVSVIIAGISSAAAWEAAPIAQSQNVPFLITTATEDKITEQGWDCVFRINPPFSEYGNGMLWFLSEVVKAKTIAILRARGFTGLLRSSEMVKHCMDTGYEIIFDHVYEEDTEDFRQVLRQVKAKKPDVIAMASYLNDAVNIMRQAKELDINPLLFVGLGGGFTLPQFGEQAMEAANYVYSISVWNQSVPYAGSREYYENYRSRYGIWPDYHGAEIYAGMQVVVDALNRSQSLDPEGLRAALLSTDMITIIGPVKFVAYGKKERQNRLPTYLVQWIDGVPKTVWPPRLACQKYIYPFPGWKGR